MASALNTSTPTVFNYASDTFSPSGSVSARAAAVRKDEREQARQHFQLVGSRRTALVHSNAAAGGAAASDRGKDQLDKLMSTMSLVGKTAGQTKQATVARAAVALAVPHTARRAAAGPQKVDDAASRAQLGRPHLGRPRNQNAAAASSSAPHIAPTPAAAPAQASAAKNSIEQDAAPLREEEAERAMLEDRALEMLRVLKDPDSEPRRADDAYRIGSPAASSAPSPTTAALVPALRLEPQSYTSSQHGKLLSSPMSAAATDRMIYAGAQLNPRLRKAVKVLGKDS